MRAKEFISEAELNDWHKQAIPGLRSLTGVNQYYELYRFGIAMAGAGRTDEPNMTDPFGITADNPTTSSYTDAEEKIINDALKHSKKTAKKMSSKQSEEPTDTYTQSPVPVYKKVRGK